MKYNNRFNSNWTTKERSKIVKEVSSLVLSRRTKMCNVSLSFFFLFKKNNSNN